MHKLTITIYGGGCSVKHNIDFRPPCLAAPSWLMMESMILSFSQNDIPVLAYQLGTGVGIPRNAAEGILIGGKPICGMEHILITLEPIPLADEGCRESHNSNDFEGRAFSLSAVLKQGREIVSYLFTETVEYPSSLANVMTQAVERAEIINVADIHSKGI